MSRNPSTVVIVAVGAALVVLFAGASVVLAVGHPVPTELWAAAGALSGALVGILAPAPSTTTAAELTTVQTASAEVTRAALEQARQVAAEEQVGSPAARAAAAALAKVQAPSVVGLSALTSVRACAALPDLARAAAGATIAAHEANRTDAAAGLSEDEAAVTAKVLAAAAQGAKQASEKAQAAAIAAGDAAPSKRIRVDLRLVWLGGISVIAFAFGIWLVFQVGHDKGAEAFEKDVALRNAATTLMALGSSAAGALVGLLAPQPTESKPAA